MRAIKQDELITALRTEPCGDLMELLTYSVLNSGRCSVLVQGVPGKTSEPLNHWEIFDTRANESDYSRVLIER